MGNVFIGLNTEFSRSSDKPFEWAVEKAADFRDDIDGVKQKRCTKCKKWKDEIQFSKDSKNKDGLGLNECRSCRSTGATNFCNSSQI